MASLLGSLKNMFRGTVPQVASAPQLPPTSAQCTAAMTRIGTLVQGILGQLHADKSKPLSSNEYTKLIHNIREIDANLKVIENMVPVQFETDELSLLISNLEFTQEGLQGPGRAMEEGVSQSLGPNRENLEYSFSNVNERLDQVLLTMQKVASARAVCGIQRWARGARSDNVEEDIQDYLEGVRFSNKFTEEGVCDESHWHMVNPKISMLHDGGEREVGQARADVAAGSLDITINGQKYSALDGKPDKVVEKLFSHIDRAAEGTQVQPAQWDYIMDALHTSGFIQACRESQSIVADLAAKFGENLQEIRGICDRYGMDIDDVKAVYQPAPVRHGRKHSLLTITSNEITLTCQPYWFTMAPNYLSSALTGQRNKSFGLRLEKQVIEITPTHRVWVEQGEDGQPVPRFELTRTIRLVPREEVIQAELAEDVAKESAVDGGDVESKDGEA